MGLPKTIYDVFKAVMTTETRIADITKELNRLSDKVEANASRFAAVAENHAERLARLEGKFELLEHTLSAPRRRLTEKSS